MQKPVPDRHDLVARAAQQNRTRMFRTIFDALGHRLSAEELDIHFTHMPARYWSRATVDSVTRHLVLVNEFFAKLNTSEGTVPVLRWNHVPSRGITEVTVCTWDRLGLLAKVAGAFSAVRLNIVRADIFTRADNVVLDVFEVCESEGECVRNERRLERAAELLAAALRPNPPALRLPVPDPASRPQGTPPPEITFDTQREDNHTALIIEADDRVGLLYDILNVLTECEANVAHAIITTDNGRAGDVFYLTDAEGKELTLPARLEEIRTRLAAML